MECVYHLPKLEQTPLYQTSMLCDTCQWTIAHLLNSVVNWKRYHSFVSSWSWLSPFMEYNSRPHVLTVMSRHDWLICFIDSNRRTYTIIVRHIYIIVYLNVQSKWHSQCWRQVKSSMNVRRYKYIEKKHWLDEHKQLT